MGGTDLQEAVDLIIRHLVRVRGCTARLFTLDLLSLTPRVFFTVSGCFKGKGSRRCSRSYDAMPTLEIKTSSSVDPPLRGLVPSDNTAMVFAVCLFYHVLTIANSKRPVQFLLMKEQRPSPIIPRYDTDS